MDTIKLNTNQQKTLKEIVAAGKVDAKAIDKRSAGALEKRGLVKFSTSKSGTFVTPTAKGKKFQN